MRRHCAGLFLCSGAEGVRPLLRVGVLLEPDHLAVTEPPDVCELDVHRLRGGFHRPSIAPFRQDDITRVRETLRGDQELVVVMRELLGLIRRSARARRAE